MNRNLRENAEGIAKSAIKAVCPDEAVRRALEGISVSGDLYLVAVGKAGWQMAAAALRYLKYAPKDGIVITKYDHVIHPLPGIRCFEAGHPVPDEKSFLATQAVLDMTADLKETDTVLFLLSGGGSALFEKTLVDPEILAEVTRRMLVSGADITQINAIRKRLSGVKGGRFALWCAPARIEAVILSDIIGDPVDMIASGPAAADPVTAEEAMRIAQKYGLTEFPAVAELIEKETPKHIENVNTQIIGSVSELCRAAKKAAEALGYDAQILTDRMDCEAADMGRWLAALGREKRGTGKRMALIAGGETVVHVTGSGLGGRNQELALAAAEILDGTEKICLISVGSDGTDGPTDAAGGYVDGDSMTDLAQAGLDYCEMMDEHDSYHALGAIGGLVMTGPTGTNVNDVTIVLIDK